MVVVIIGIILIMTIIAPLVVAMIVGTIQILLSNKEEQEKMVD